MSKCPECNVNGVIVKDDCLTCGGFGIVLDITVKEHEEAIAEKDQRIAALEAERDEALRCLRRCGVAASDILTNHGGITAQAQHAMDNPLQADQMVNDRIAELECSEAQLKAENESLQARLGEVEALNDVCIRENACIRQRTSELQRALWQAEARNCNQRHDNANVLSLRAETKARLGLEKQRAEAAEAKLAAVREHVKNGILATAFPLDPQGDLRAAARAFSAIYELVKDTK